jgi:hypothetical protein
MIPCAKSGKVMRIPAKDVTVHTPAPCKKRKERGPPANLGEVFRDKLSAEGWGTHYKRAPLSSKLRLLL